MLLFPIFMNFPQKVIDRSQTGQYTALPGPGSISSQSTSSGIGGYVYLQPSQQHYAPPPQQQQQQIIYQHQPSSHQMCHQNSLISGGSSAASSSSNIVGVGGSGIGVSSNNSIASNSSSQQSHFSHTSTHHHHHHLHHGGGGVVVGGNNVGIASAPIGIPSGHPHHGGAIVVAGTGVGTGVGNSALQTMHKKNSVRNNGDVLKRTRAQTAYELSQDLLEKQIELLERKYGGLRARNAAITIQRAFRHYMMVKKFASITAMAKAEKRLSRRMMSLTGAGTIIGVGSEDGPPSNTSSSAYGSASESQIESQSNGQISIQQSLQGGSAQQQQGRVCATITAGPPPGCHSSGSPSNRIPPTRSMSLRERRQLDSSPIPRSQSGNTSPMPPASSSSACWSQSSQTSVQSAPHPHVNLLHASEQLYYSQQPHQPTQYIYQGQAYHSVPHDASFNSTSTNNSHMDLSLNSSWNSPHTPYYTAAQIYMRPRQNSHLSSSTSSTNSSSSKRVPPEVPKRTSSMTSQEQRSMMRQTPPPPSSMGSGTTRSNGLCKTSENGSLTSVQSSGSDSSAERMVNCDLGSDRSNSPQTWKRGTNLNSSAQYIQSTDHMIMMSASHPAPNNASTVGANDDLINSHTSAAQYEHQHQDHNEQMAAVAAAPQNYKVSETIRKRQYRVGLNLFNKKPEKGITYLIRRGFLENTPQGVARFLISRKGLSRQMIGEYLGNLQNPFNMAVLECFAAELDLSGMQVDVALRKFQAYFRMPGEAQKIERLMEIFSQRFCQCNSDIVGRLRSSDTIFVLAFAIIMLNTDLHTPNLKPERRMRVDDFIKNLRGIDDCHDIDREMLVGIYERVKANEFKPGSDHVTQVMKVQATIVGKKPNLALPHRRLVCYCRLYEIPDVNKKERPGVHQREVFLFNDLLVITKIFSKKKSSVTYTFRNSYPLCGMVVTLLDVPNYPYCMRLSQKVDGKVLVTFNARNEHDRCKFAEDLRESISEMDEMESLRIEAELERQKSSRGGNRASAGAENRDSGVADVEVCPCPYQSAPGTETTLQNSESSAQLKRSALSNSLLDIHEQFGNEKPQRRGSVGSLDSGMSVSFQSTTASNASRENAAMIAAAANAAAAAAKIRYPVPGSQQSAHHIINNHQHHHHQQQIHPQTTYHLHGPVHTHPVPVTPQLQQQQQPQTGRIPGRERKASRTDNENNRSTEV
ncbi:IQ motif and SEC7 domain-containing protein 1 isoform X2 [Condylostylus longicornis]|uniref:IQ motif and SEC7 domain-containing protein 1 isoform X2 n=1 Tax=Condylostylus longicornis TaxID=2530218 RepID=UPI00244E5B33|nr:IQ motif and SEC7 domain-containing protein 1 isoform X2 [Condylostylus longicornis]